MSDGVETRLREELHEAVAGLAPPVDLVGEVHGRLRRRARRTTWAAAATAAVVVAGVAFAAAALTPGRSAAPAGGQHAHPSPGATAAPPALFDALTNQVLPARRSFALPHGWVIRWAGGDYIAGAAAADVLYVLAGPQHASPVTAGLHVLRIPATGGGVAVSTATFHLTAGPILAVGQLWIGDGNDLVALDPATLTVTRRIPLGRHPATQITATSHYLWAIAGRALIRVTPTTGALLRLPPSNAGDRFFGVAADPTTSTLYTTEGPVTPPTTTTAQGTLSRRDPLTGTVLASVQQPGYYQAPLNGADHGHVWLRDVGQGLHGMNGAVDVVNERTLNQQTLGGDNTITVALHDGLAWLTSAAFNVNGKPALFACADPASATTRAAFTLASHPHAAYDQLPARPNLKAPELLASSREWIFARYSATVAAYPLGRLCTGHR